MKKDLPIYLFHQGTNYNTYELLGCHFGTNKGKKGAYFRTWAPNAVSVSLVGDFNKFSVNEGFLPMEKISNQGIWECFVENTKVFDAYKFLIETASGKKILKADPYAFHSETQFGRTASKVWDIDKEFEWQDKEWFEYNKADILSRPMNIYEVNLNSFKRKENGDYLTYRELADDLSEYVAKMGYTHIELMPLTEYPYDGSWGYQVTGFYSLTSRFGTPDDFVYFINKFHQKNIGVLLDWVPAHFAKDDFALIEFDGEPLYEAHGWDRMEHKDWGTRCFDFGRNEVQCFLISSAIFWLGKYHIDGLRVDAVASMLYLDYSKKPGEWIPNIYGGNQNLEAIAFLRKLNTQIRKQFPQKIIIAEESTAFEKVTKPAEEGGLGFHFKWNMGWMNDVLQYMSIDPYFRKHHHNKLTFSFMYCFSENYILPISHDEVVHGKKSLIDKMSGEYEDKFANMRTLMGYKMAHPGKKLLFMGCEFAQFREWDFENGLEFFMLGYSNHKKMQDYIKALNHFYSNSKQLYQIDDSYEGIYFNNADDSDNNVLAFSRKAKDGSELLAVMNFSPVTRKKYLLGVGFGTYERVFNSDETKFGGKGIRLATKVQSKNIECNKFADSVSLTLPGLSVQFYKKI